METAAADRLLRNPEVLALAGIGRTLRDRLERAGKFPSRVYVTRNCVAWSEREVLAWVDARKAGRDVPLDERRARRCTADALDGTRPDP